MLYYFCEKMMKKKEDSFTDLFTMTLKPIRELFKSTQIDNILPFHLRYGIYDLIFRFF